MKNTIYSIIFSILILSSSGYVQASGSCGIASLDLAVAMLNLEEAIENGTAEEVLEALDAANDAYAAVFHP